MYFPLWCACKKNFAQPQTIMTGFHPDLVQNFNRHCPEFMCENGLVTPPVYSVLYSFQQHGRINEYAARCFTESESVFGFPGLIFFYKS